MSEALLESWRGLRDDMVAAERRADAAEATLALIRKCCTYWCRDTVEGDDFDAGCRTVAAGIITILDGGSDVS